MKKSIVHTASRFILKVAGESGQGINSVGEILAEALKDSGYHVFAYREYPSLIRGGMASYQVEFSDQPITAPSRNCDILVCVSRLSLHSYLRDVTVGGRIIHSVEHVTFTPEEQSYLAENKIAVEYINATRIAIEAGGRALLANTVFLGIIWSILGYELPVLEAVVIEKFGKRKHLLEANKTALKVGHSFELEQITALQLSYKPDKTWQDSLMITGNQSLSLGAIKAGVRAFYAYPMTPASSILSFLASVYHKTGMLVKQAEDEITAAQLALGSMAMGTRALTGTSGGGFDLMTETVSLAGMIEVPFVCVLAQRPGPATGLPTWTSAGDLNLALYSAHGEFPRMVLAASDALSAFELIAHGFNFAEEFQIPVIVLTEKQIAESLFNHAPSDFSRNIPIIRGLVSVHNRKDLKPSDRYGLTDSGVSLRWNPGEAGADYDLNSDEHLEDGSLTEDALTAQAMMDKRFRKLETVRIKLPEPILYGDPDAAVTFIGWGSPKTAVLDAISQGADCNYLHFEYLWPLRTEKIIEVFKNAKKTVIIEQNATGQFAQLVAATTQLVPDAHLRKYNGRPFFVEEILEYLKV